MFRSKPALLLTLLAHSTRELLLSEDSLREALTLNYPQREEGTHMPLPYPLISPSSSPALHKAGGKAEDSLTLCEITNTRSECSSTTEHSNADVTVAAGD